MNYETGILLFRTKYDIEVKKSKVQYPSLTNNEIMMLLSEVQAELGNKYKIYERIATLDLVLNDSTYTVGTGASNIPKDLLMIKEMEINNATVSTATVNNEPLVRISKEDMNRIIKQNGTPGKYTIYGIDDNKVLEIDSVPDYSYADDSSYRINYIYIGRLELFDSTAGTSSSVSFSDYNTSSAGFGGSWKIPAQWHQLIVEGAIANLFEYKKAEYKANVLSTYSATPKVVTRANKYHLGIPYS